VTSRASYAGAVTTSERREPTNDQLWAQPPVGAAPAAPGQGLAPYIPPAPAALNLPAQAVRGDRTQFVLAIVSLGVGVPLTAIGAGVSGLPGLLIVWIGIVLVNLVYGRTHRRP
jgi:hypothetical protein